MRTLRMKMVMIMVILILALMTVIGAFLISGVGNFYISEFYVQMERTFSPEFITQLQDLADGENGPTQMKELLMAQTGLGIDVNDRNVYILDSLGQVRSAGAAGAGQHRRDRHGDIYRPGDGGVWCAGARCERPRHDAAAAGGVRGAGSGQRAVGQEGRAGHAGGAARDV